VFACFEGVQSSCVIKWEGRVSAALQMLIRIGRSSLVVADAWVKEAVKHISDEVRYDDSKGHDVENRL
jgi:hypothetical protein